MLLVRRWLTDRTTIGELFIDPKDEGNRGFECYTLEDVYRGDDPAAKVKGKTAIPCGTYELVVRHSPKYNTDMPRLLKVPGFDGILIHVGNDETDTEGCILVGHTREENKVGFSRPAFAQLNQKLRHAIGKGEAIHITIKIQ
jgi:hypothetical protein